MWTASAIIHDKEGRFKAAAMFGGSGKIPVMDAEARVMIIGLQLVVDLGLKSLEVESDSTSLVGYLNSNLSPRAYIGSLYDDIRQYVTLLDVVSFTFRSQKV